MATKPTGKFYLNLPKKLNHLFTGVKGKVTDWLSDAITSPLSWRSLMWDSNIANEFPDRLIRAFRYVIGFTYITHILNLASVGLFLIFDSLYSIYRNRFELQLTKNWTDDVPRFARCLLGIVFIASSVNLF